MHTLDDEMVEHTLEHMIRHNFPIGMMDNLDPYQINQMIWHCVDIFKNTKYPDSYLPSSSNRSFYTDMGNKLGISKKQIGQNQSNFCTSIAIAKWKGRQGNISRKKRTKKEKVHQRRCSLTTWARW